MIMIISPTLIIDDGPSEEKKQVQEQEEEEEKEEEEEEKNNKESSFAPSCGITTPPDTYYSTVGAFPKDGHIRPVTYVAW